ncbi:tyrosine-type recombinase/integrase [Exilibacterium tricleocarpae]|uniref:Tyrosine-type recombinase/integrase n=1 Tax=Exilibacterium tricleocarpae TaxID=2591008 RepID=A0A545U4B7_9GAMM|nr:tyrosine-type recombinase/integrase [Exilibacterium tricleocarpae]TQV84243.1 tyrosine-type recombinase/integrase [Exilibacterium tricleocarpae]
MSKQHPPDKDLSVNIQTIQSESGTSNTAYYYLLPTGERIPLGTDRQEASKAASKLDQQFIGRYNQEAFPLKTPGSRKNPLLATVIDKFYTDRIAEKHRRGKISARTTEEKRYKLEEYKQTWINRDIQSIETLDLAEFLEGKTGHVQAKHGPLLRDLFRYAVNKGWIKHNPAAELETREPEDRRRRRHTLEGLMAVRAASPTWLQRAINVALYSLQRRTDLVEIDCRKQISKEKQTIEILQQKTRRYKRPVYIEISATGTLWQAISECLDSGVSCPYLIHYRPQRQRQSQLASKPHPCAVLPAYLSRQFTKYRDKSGAYDYIVNKAERPTFHDIRALGILLYFKAGYSIEYIMALAGHAKQATTDSYVKGHEKARPVTVHAGLDLAQISPGCIDWDDAGIPGAIQSLLNEKG